MDATCDLLPTRFWGYKAKHDMGYTIGHWDVVGQYMHAYVGIDNL